MKTGGTSDTVSRRDVTSPDATQRSTEACRTGAETSTASTGAVCFFAQSTDTFTHSEMVNAAKFASDVTLIDHHTI